MITDLPLRKESFNPVTPVTAAADSTRQNRCKTKEDGEMTSTRLASTTSTLGMGEAGQRNRVDPVKLLALIHRIKSASGDTPSPLMHPQPKPVAKAG